jgi:hypothetical protein
MKVTKARILAGVLGWLLLLAPLLLPPEGPGVFASGVMLTGLGALLALGAWRLARFVLARVRSGRRRTLKTQGTIVGRHLERTYEGGGTLVRWVVQVSFPTATKEKGRIDWAPYDAYTNSERLVDRVDRDNPEGKTLTVFVDPDDPSNASVGARMNVVLYPGLAVAALGLALSLVSLVVLSCLFVATSFATLWRWLS